MALRMREAESPEVALARQRAEKELPTSSGRVSERLAGLDRLIIVRHGPVRHVATALVLPATAGAERSPRCAEDIDPEHPPPHRTGRRRRGRCI